MLPNSSSASFWNLSRAWSADKVEFLDVDGNVEPEDSPPDMCEAIDEGEYVGFGCATPSCLSLSEKAGFATSGSCGSIESARIAVTYEYGI